MVTGALALILAIHGEQIAGDDGKSTSKRCDWSRLHWLTLPRKQQVKFRYMTRKRVGLLDALVVYTGPEGVRNRN